MFQKIEVYKILVGILKKKEDFFKSFKKATLLMKN